MTNSKRTTGSVILMLKDIRVEGEIYTEERYSRGRISDAINRPDKRFIAVTDAKIFNNADGALVKKESYISINLEHIVYVKPNKGMAK